MNNNNKDKLREILEDAAWTAFEAGMSKKEIREEIENALGDVGDEEK
jgi:energy-coupling factor transporter ATP-binding protein EcfA2